MKAIVVVENWTNCEDVDMYCERWCNLGVASNNDIARKLIDSRIEEWISEARKVEPTVEVERVDIGHLPVLHIRHVVDEDEDEDVEQYSYAIESHDLIDDEL